MSTLFECYRDIIPDFNLFLESLSRPMPVHLRVNSLKVEPADLVSMLGERGVDLRPSSQLDNHLYNAASLESPGNLPEYLLGYIHPQALTSCLASVILSPSPYGYVLDMCASPGGKTSHLAQMMNNSGLIVANEPDRKRHIPLAHTLARLGVANTVATSYQAQEFPLSQRFDYVLADVPCSGEGRVRIVNNYGDTSGRPAKGTGRSMRGIQKRLILRGCDLLKDGGEMLYSTCTYNPEENESVVNFLLQNRDVAVLPIDPGFGYDKGLIRWRDEKYDRQLEGTARFYPHRNDSVGFFMAKIRKGRKV
ncbi:MAG: RsmB/NOP family class I SAM-dependent RNA methyltransferase [Deltaproteobacteria bacterium]|nr:RsmB/NOP family class I SAM-dependent RNA methyltransferase [Deltaproteobacteria bacterium]